MSGEPRKNIGPLLARGADVLVTVAVAGIILYHSVVDGLTETRPLLQAILAVLLVLALSETVHRTVGLTKIDRDLATVLSFHNDIVAIQNDLTCLLQHGAPMAIISDKQALWIRAIELLDSAGEFGTIYDSCSFKNRDAYEEKIEQQRILGATVTRYICSETTSSLTQFIRPPKPQSRKLDDSYLLRHIPIVLPFDCLVVQSRTSTAAIIAFRTSHEANEFSTAFYVEGTLARDLYLIHENFYAEATRGHSKGARHCAICKEIAELKENKN